MSNAFPRSDGASRRARIVDLVNEAGYYQQVDLAARFGVSEMTIRRDGRVLADQGLVKRVHGGLRKAEDAFVVPEFRLRARSQRDSKRRIVQAALSLVRPATTIALDAGTTTLGFARLLPAEAHLTVVTGSLPIVVALADRPDIEINALGGLFHRHSQAFAGPETIEALRRIHADQVFLGATAIGRGAMWCGNAWESEIKQAMIKIADEVILLADSSKCQVTAMARVAPLSALTCIVVDDRLSVDDRKAFEDAGVRVLIPPTAADDHTDRVTATLEANP